MNGDSNLINKVKQTGKHSFIFLLGSGAQSALNFILLPVITKNIIPADYGTYSLIMMVGTIASSAFYLGGTSAMSRFFFEKGDTEYRKRVFSSCFLITLFGFVVQLSFGLIFSRLFSQFLFDSKDYYIHIIGILAATGFGFIFNYLLLHLRIERRSVLFSVANILMFILNFGITYILLEYIQLGFSSLIIGLLVSNFVGCVVLIVGLRKNFLITFNNLNLAQYLKFGMPAVVISMAGYLMDWLDRVVLNVYVHPSDLGIYSFGCRIGLLILAMYVTPFSMVWSSIRWEFAKDEDTSFFFAFITKLYTVIGLACILLFSLFLNDILDVLSNNEEYKNANPIIPVIFISQLIYGYLNILDFGIYLNKRLNIYMFVFISGIIVNIILNVIFIPTFGYVAAAYCKLATFTFCVASIHYISNKYFTIKIDVFRILIPYLLLLPIVNLISNLRFTFVLNVLFNIVLATGFSLSMIVMLFSRKEKHILKNIAIQFYTKQV